MRYPSELDCAVVCESVEVTITIHNQSSNKNDCMYYGPFHDKCTCMAAYDVVHVLIAFEVTSRVALTLSTPSHICVYMACTVCFSMRVFKFRNTCT
jgi:hypothetical protein